jgi:hypothetical protein
MGHDLDSVESSLVAVMGPLLKDEMAVILAISRTTPYQGASPTHGF